MGQKTKRTRTKHVILLIHVAIFITGLTSVHAESKSDIQSAEEQTDIRAGAAAAEARDLVTQTELASALAVQEAQDLAKKEINEAATKIKIAEERAEAAEAEARELVTQMESESALAVQEAQALAKQEIDKARAQIKIAEERADKDIKAAEVEANERIAQIESDWASDVYEERALATKKIQFAIADSERVKKQSEEGILDARGKANVQIEEMKIKSDTLVENAVMEKDEAIATAKADGERLRRESSAQITTARDDAKDQIEKALQQAKDDIEAAKLNADLMIAQGEETATNAISIEIQKAEDAINGAKEETARVKSEAEQAISESNRRSKDEIDEIRRKSQQTAKELRDQVKKLQNEIGDLHSHRDELHTTLHSTRESLQFWEEKEDPYCNFTLMRMDSEDNLFRAYTISIDAISDVGDVAVKKATAIGNDIWVHHVHPTMLKVMDDHVEPMYKAHLEPMYETHVAPVMKGTVEPFYRKNVDPVFKSHIVPTWNNAISKVVSTAEDIVKMLYDLYHLAKRKVHLVSTNVLKQHSDSLPVPIVSFLEYCQAQSDEFLTRLLWVALITVIFFFRHTLLSMMIYILCVPFRIIWFFSPLRLLFRRKVVKVEDELKGIDCIEDFVASQNDIHNKGKEDVKN